MVISKMPEVIFKVLCANDSDSCDRVKKVMKDLHFSIDTDHKGRDFDHIGRKNFPSFLEARKDAKEIESVTGSDLVSIKIRPKL